MNHQKSIIDAIIKVITEHECAVVPGFGGFILRRNPGMFNVFSGELKASTAILYFNAEIKEDDGLVATALKELTGLNYKNCQSLISAWKDDLHAIAVEKGHYSILPLGNFHKNTQGGLFFVSSPSLNLDPYSFGLPQFHWKWDLFDQPDSVTQAHKEHVIINPDSTELIQPPASDTLEKEYASHEIDSDVVFHSDALTNSSDKPGLIWQIAASLAIISVSTSLYFTFSQLLPGKKNAELVVANMNTPPKPEEENKLVRVREIEKSKPACKRKFELGDLGIKKQHDSLQKMEGEFYVTGASYITEIPAKRECLAWQKLGYDVCIAEVSGSSLKKVILGRFKTEEEASSFAKAIKEMPTGTISVIESKFKW